MCVVRYVLAQSTNTHTISLLFLVGRGRSLVMLTVQMDYFG